MCQEDLNTREDMAWMQQWMEVMQAQIFVFAAGDNVKADQDVIK